MIVVADTNVLVSALLSSTGSPAEFLRRWESGAFDLATSPVLFTELKEALAYTRVQRYLKQSVEDLTKFLKHYQSVAITFEPHVSVNVLKNDPDDNQVLACAVSANAAYVVSGDEQLLNLKEYQGIIILPPAGFIAVLDFQKGEK